MEQVKSTCCSASQQVSRGSCQVLQADKSFDFKAFEIFFFILLCLPFPQRHYKGTFQHLIYNLFRICLSSEFISGLGSTYMFRLDFADFTSTLIIIHLLFSAFLNFSSRQVITLPYYNFIRVNSVIH